MVPPPQSPSRLGVNTNDLDNSGNDEERLIVRVDQPIENVPFLAHTLLRGVDGGVLTPSSRRIEYKWFRSRTIRNCSYSRCPTQRKVARLQSLLNGKRYCSGNCLLQDSASSDRVIDKSMLSSVDLSLDYKGTAWGILPFQEDNSWEQISSSKSYTPMGEDVGHVLKVECSAMTPDDRVSVSCQSKETGIVIGVSEGHYDRLLSSRKFVHSRVIQRKYPSTGSKGFVSGEGGGALLRIMTYNVLAEVYATKQLYPYCPLWALSWGYRRQLVLLELLKHEADVICLQEMQVDHFEEFMLPELKKAGYDGFIKSKTRESMGRKGKIDGCAIFYRKSRLRLVDTVHVEYNQIAINMAQAGGFQRPGLSPAENKRRTSRVLSRLCKDNIGVIATFETVLQGFANDPTLFAAVNKTGPQRLSVATTHIFWDPEYSDVKFWQSQAMMQELAHAAGDTPLVFCGDLNSTPDSLVVQYLNCAHESINPSHPDLQNDPLQILPDVSMMHHGLELTSVYKAVTGKEPECTNYTAHYSGVLDYIFVSGNNVTPLAVLQVPDEDTRRGEDDTFMPNVSYPSDHISLCFDVGLNPLERIRSCPGTPTPPSPSLSPHQTMSPSYDPHHQQYRHAGHRSSSLGKQQQMHSPNPAMVNLYMQQQQQQQQQGGGRHSPALHSQQQHHLMQQQNYY